MIVPKHFFDFAEEVKNNFSFINGVHEFGDHDGFGLELIAPMHKVHHACDVGQIERFFKRGVAPAHDGDRFFTVEEPVAGGAG